jgi:hypothetical protein
MDPRRIASTAAIVGGVALLMKVGLIWGNGGVATNDGPVLLMYVLGFAALFVALAAAGYTLVESAPVWLRGVVAIATPLLVLMMWELFDQGVKSVYPGNSWVRDEVSIVLAAGLAILMGMWGFTRHRPYYEEDEAPLPPPPVRGRRAAR